MKDINCWESKFKLCRYSERLLIRLCYLNKIFKPPINISEIKKAIYYAKKYHGEQKRQSGEPYYTHPIEVAYLAADRIFDTNILVTSILHDTLEDTDLTKEDLSYIFSPVIADQVEALTRIKINKKITSAELLELLHEQQRHDLLVIKLLDRVHNMQTIEVKSSSSQEKIILETLINFLPMAAHLSLFDIEQILDQTCFNAASKKLHKHYEEILVFEEDYQPLSREPQSA